MVEKSTGDNNVSNAAKAAFAAFRNAGVTHPDMEASADTRGGNTHILYNATKPPFSATELQEAAINYLYAQPALKSSDVAEENPAELKLKKLAEIMKIDGLLAMATDSELIRMLNDLKHHISDARSSGEIDRVRVVLSTATSAAVAKAATNDTMDMQALQQALHEQLYKTDALYRMEMDRIAGEADKIVKKADGDLESAAEYAKNNGYSSEAGKEAEELKQKIESEKNPLEKLRLQAEYYKKLEQHYKELERQARERSDEHGAERFGSSAQESARIAQQELLKLYDEAKEKLIEATRRKLAQDGNLSAADIKELETLSLKLDRDKQRALSHTQSTSNDTYDLSHLHNLARQVEDRIKIAEAADTGAKSERHHVITTNTIDKPEDTPAAPHNKPSGLQIF